MFTRSRSRKRATSSPPQEGPVSEALVGRLSSATGLPRDENSPFRPASVVGGPSRVCSESVEVEQGPAQGVGFAGSRIFAEFEYSDISSPDNPPISTQTDRQPLPTLVPFAELDTRGIDLHSHVLYRASSVASPHALPFSGAG